MFSGEEQVLERAEREMQAAGESERCRHRPWLDALSRELEDHRAKAGIQSLKGDRAEPD